MALANMIETLYVILIITFVLSPFAGILALIIGWNIWFRRQEERRATAIETLASQLGLAFHAYGDQDLLTTLGHCSLLSHCREKTVKNVFQGRTDHVQYDVFDFQYVVGIGGNRRTYRRTMIAFHSKELRLPDFALRPEDLGDTITKAFGYQDINFESHPIFSKAFVLRGSEEARIRATFAPDVLSFFEQHTEVCVERCGDRLIVYYRDRVRLELDQFQPFIDLGFKVYGVFRNRP